MSHSGQENLSLVNGALGLGKDRVAREELCALRSRVTDRLTRKWGGFTDAGSISSAANWGVAVVGSYIQAGIPVNDEVRMATTVGSRALNEERRKNPQRLEANIHDFDQDVALNTATPEAIVQSEFFQNFLEAAVMGLPEAERMILLERMLDDVPYERIAHASGSSPGATRNKVYRARNKLRDTMKSQGVSDDVG